ncbi:hypothetical protein SLEP1_g21566 [Rubroshorea leprosula]|uniref:Transmembrane protein n=1 Tax=Rubroshorea leprosula TaxID=152421 RepID=A0AAV5J6D6_9ROSI|nr:hypothetical protein SLEP1_g21566 [Rubroshorea leprosula]
MVERRVRRNPNYWVLKSLSSTSKSFHFLSPSPTPNLGSFAGSHLLNFILCVPVKLMMKRKMRLQMIRMRMEVRRKMDLVRTVNNKKEKGKERREREKEGTGLGMFGVNGK